MSEETAYAALSAELHGGVSVSSDGGPDLPGLFPSLEQDQEPFSSTDLPLPVSGKGSCQAAFPPAPPALSEAPLASETASEESETNFGALMAQDAGSSACPKPESLQVALRGHPSFRVGSAEWHVMDASLRLARNHRLQMPWDRQVRIRLSEPSLFQEPLLGRFDSAVCRKEPILFRVRTLFSL